MRGLLSVAGGAFSFVQGVGTAFVFVWLLSEVLSWLG